jgi:hypothetical protein
MLNKINGKPAQMEHHISIVRTPDSFTLRCDCGWRSRESRRQNARARAAKERAAVAEHERNIAPAQVVSWMAG